MSTHPLNTGQANPQTTEPQRGWFKVWCDGEVMASGIGPYDVVKAEANHYALVYADNHTVKVRVQRIGRRKADAVTNTVLCSSRHKIGAGTYPPRLNDV